MTALAAAPSAQQPAPTAVPGTMRGIFDALREDRRESQALIDHGDFILLYAPQDRVRDRALALDRYVATLRPAARHRADLAILAVVRTAWFLDVAVDEGTDAQASAAFMKLKEALDELFAAFAIRR